MGFENYINLNASGQLRAIFLQVYSFIHPNCGHHTRVVRISNNYNNYEAGPV